MPDSSKRTERHIELYELLRDLHVVVMQLVTRLGTVVMGKVLRDVDQLTFSA